MGIIAALKKWYKYLYLKDVLDFYELTDEVKNHKKGANKAVMARRRRCQLWQSCTLLDATNYVKCAWDSISASTIKNAVIKAKIMNLPNNNEQEEIDDSLITDVMQAMEALQMSI